eukprot:7097348-Prymnesium_polylepis.1
MQPEFKPLTRKVPLFGAASYAQSGGCNGCARSQASAEPPAGGKRKAAQGRRKGGKVPSESPPSARAAPHASQRWRAWAGPVGRAGKGAAAAAARKTARTGLCADAPRPRACGAAWTARRDHHKRPRGPRPAVAPPLTHAMR